MAKSKHAPALFEVIKRQQDKVGASRLSLPKWWRSVPDQGRTDSAPGETTESAEVSGPPPDGAEDAAPVAKEQVATQAVRSSSPEPPGRPVVAEQPGRAVERESLSNGSDAESDRWLMDQPAVPPPVFRVRGGRLEISLNPMNAVVVAGGLLLAMLCVYQLGARLGAPSPLPMAEPAIPGATDPVDEIAAREPQPGVLNLETPSKVGAGEAASRRPQGQMESPTGRDSRGGEASETVATGVGQRVAGLNYVVLESFKGEDLEDARHAQEWLASQKVPTTIEKSGERWLLVSAVGFEFPAQKEQCQQYQEMVKTLGQAYKKQYLGKRQIRYDFRSPETRKWQ